MFKEKKTIKLTDEKFKEIYNSEPFRNMVAYAHTLCSITGHPKCKITCSYPVTYIVTEQQITEAKRVLVKRAAEVLKENKNNLYFMGLGCSSPTENDEEIGNPRISTEFVNAKGQQFFVEFGKDRNNKLFVTYAIDRELEKEMGLRQVDERTGETYYNYRGLEKMDLSHLKYEKRAIINIVNKYFNCNFKKLVVDNYNRPALYKQPICWSPKSTTHQKN